MELIFFFPNRSFLVCCVCAVPPNLEQPDRVGLSLEGTVPLALEVQLLAGGLRGQATGRRKPPSPSLYPTHHSGQGP